MNKSRLCEERTGKREQEGRWPQVCSGTGLLFVFFFVFFVFGLFRAAPTAYGGSQARGQIGAVALAYTTAMATPDLRRICDSHDSSQQHRILNPLSKARD